MRVRPDRIMSLSLAIVLSAALVLPAGAAFGADPAPSDRVATVRTIAKMAEGKRRAAPAPAPTVSAPAAPLALPEESVMLADPLAPAVPGQLVAVLDSVLFAASSERALEARGAEVERVSGSSSLLVSAPLGLSTPVLTQLVKETSGVSWVQPNYIYRTTYVPNDPRLAQQWGLTKIHAADAWDVTRGSNTVVVAVIDTGVDYTHPDLAGRVDSANGYDFVNGDSDATDDNGHGTHVSGIVAATMNNAIGVAGVAPESRILPVKVLSAAGSGTSAGVAAGIYYAVDHGASVINLSLASTAADRLMGDAVADARSRNCVVVAAAGNEGSSAGADYPARYAGVLGVGAVDSYSVRASFSNYGDGVDVAAPGSGILSTVPGTAYQSWNGTSMASPFVAGLAALVLSVEPGFDAEEVIDRICGTAVPVSSPGLGYGLIDAAAAVGPVVPPTGGDIPGIALDPSPVSGDLDAVFDPHRVYQVYLGTGQTLEATLTAGSELQDLDLLLYAPGSESRATGLVVDDSVGPDNPEKITYTAAETGWHYLDVHAVEGSGAYQLTWLRLGASDDEIPGVALPVTPVSDSVDEIADPDDVYVVELERDDVISVDLEGPTDGTDLDVYLYGPEAVSIFTDVRLAGSAEYFTSSERFSYRVPEAGTYYLCVEAWTGSGDYVMDWRISPFLATDNIPGVEPSSSVVAGSIGGLANSDDVYKVYLQAGQSLEITMTNGAQSAPFFPWLYIYPSTATDVEADANSILASGNSDAGSTWLSLEATATGYHYIDIYSLGDPIPYQLEWSTTTSDDDNLPGVAAPASSIEDTLGVSSDTDDVYRIHANAGQLISAALSDSDDTDFDLYLYGREATDTRSATPVARADGSAYPKALSFVATVSGDYYLHAHAFAGEGPYSLTWSVKSYAKVYEPIAPTRVTRSRSFAIYGYVAPRHSSGTYLVTLRFYLKNSSGVYAYHHSKSARRYYYSSSKTKYSTTLSLPHKGTWRVRAMHSDTAHATSYSTYDYITVR